MAPRVWLGGSLFCVLLSSTSVQAQVSAAQVWQNWKDMAATTGQTVTAAGEAMQGDTLVVTGLSFTATEPDVTVTGTLEEVRFRETGDGRVEITMSPSYPLAIRLTNPGGDEVAINLEMLQRNLRMIAAGSPDSTSYDFTAEAISMATTGVTEAGQAVPMKLSLALDAAGGNYLITRRPGEVMDLASSFNAGNVALSFAFTDPTNGNEAQVEGSVAQLATVSSGTFGAAMMAHENPYDAFAAGLAVDFAMTFGPVGYTMMVLDAGTRTDIRGKSDGGNLGFAMDRTRMAYRGGGKGVEIVASGGDIPFPELALRYSEAAVDFLMPLAKGPSPQDFVAAIRLIDLSVSDELWGMVDPMGSLARDPASLVVDARGKATLMADILDEQAMQSTMPPAQLDALDLPELLFRLAGAELTGNGALTFDNTDLMTFGGMPAPSGSINLSLTGANTLLDKLVAMGLLPEDQVMGVRMMLGVFARPGPTPDSLTSTIEFKDGGIFANGMRLPM